MKSHLSDKIMLQFSQNQCEVGTSVKVRMKPLMDHVTLLSVVSPIKYTLGIFPYIVGPSNNPAAAEGLNRQSKLPIDWREYVELTSRYFPACIPSGANINTPVHVLIIWMLNSWGLEKQTQSTIYIRLLLPRAHHRVFFKTPNLIFLNMQVRSLLIIRCLIILIKSIHTIKLVYFKPDFRKATRFWASSKTANNFSAAIQFLLCEQNKWRKWEPAQCVDTASSKRIKKRDQGLETRRVIKKSIGKEEGDFNGKSLRYNQGRISWITWIIIDVHQCHKFHPGSEQKFWVGIQLLLIIP